MTSTTRARSIASTQQVGTVSLSNSSLCRLRTFTGRAAAVAWTHFALEFSSPQKKETSRGWTSALSVFSSDSDDSDSDLSDVSDSDVSDDDLKGGGKHRKRRRQNDWRMTLLLGLALLAFIFYEEIVDAASEVRSIKRAWIEDLKKGTVAPRRALDRDVAAEQVLSTDRYGVMSPPPDPPNLDGRDDSVFRAKLEQEELSHGQTKGQLKEAHDRIFELEAKLKMLEPP